jgi:uncharacterized cupin superfamily protein
MAMSDERRHANVINIDEVEPLEREHGTRFGLKGRQLTAATGAADIGCTHYEIPPGRTAFPAHYHCGAEEAIYVLDGAGTLRIGDAEVAVRAGDFLSFPIGPESSHQLINTGDAPLRYLCMSTKVTSEVVGYPDSNKIAALAAPAGAAWGDNWVAKWFPGDADVGYYDGEPE